MNLLHETPDTLVASRNLLALTNLYGCSDDASTELGQIALRAMCEALASRSFTDRLELMTVAVAVHNYCMANLPNDGYPHGAYCVRLGDVAKGAYLSLEDAALALRLLGMTNPHPIRLHLHKADEYSVEGCGHSQPLIGLPTETGRSYLDLYHADQVGIAGMDLAIYDQWQAAQDD